MIDLDEQLTAYSRYLDDLERPLVPEVPLDGPIDAPTQTSRRRFLTVSAAAAVAIAGGAVIARVATRGDGRGSSNLARLDPDWELVPDPDGLFLPAPMRDDMIPGAEPNSIEIRAVADTSFGLIAVGSELRDLIGYNAMWRSDDAVTWERLPNDDDFGTTEFTGSSARTLGNLVEFDGRLVGSDSSNFWWTDDLQHWESVDIPLADVALGAGFLGTSMTSGPPGIVAASFGLWFSPDGADWRVIDGYANLVTLFAGCAAFVGDQFVIAGSSVSSNIVLTSADGLGWASHELPGQEGDAPFAVAGAEDTLVVLGSVLDQENGAWLQAIAWVSKDRGSTWTRMALGGVERRGIYPNVLVHVGGEFVAVAARGAAGDARNVQYRSADGLEWFEHPVDPTGFRSGATTFRDGAVAVGSGGWPWMIGGPSSTTQPPEGAAADPRNAASIWTLGL